MERSIWFIESKPAFGLGGPKTRCVLAWQMMMAEGLSSRGSLRCVCWVLEGLEGASYWYSRPGPGEQVPTVRVDQSTQ